MSDIENLSDEKKLLKRVYDLLNEGQGFAHLEVDGVEAEKILEEIRKLKVA